MFAAVLLFCSLLAEPATTKIFAKSSKTIDTMKFFLYRKGCNSPIVITEKNATDQIDVSISTYIIIHGWSGSGTLPWIQKLAKTLHQVKNFNIIAADWSILASLSYIKAVKKIKDIGYHIKDFIKSLKVSIGTVQIFGHSLGAEIAAYVGRGLGTLGTQKVEQIIGCDPAGPLFDWPFRLLPQSRLSADDGQFVQIIHTAILLVGTTTPLGTIDFYVNKGIIQPGCSHGNKVSCSHQMCLMYYIQTISKPEKYLGTKWCFSKIFGCKTDIAYMGYGVNRTKSGIYKVTTVAKNDKF